MTIRTYEDNSLKNAYEPAHWHWPEARPLAVMKQVVNWLEHGKEAAIALIVNIDGRSSRAIGTMMAISGGSARAGSISSGCFDAAVAAEAVAAIDERKGRLIRLGRGSEWIDIRLPCGSGLDLLIVPITNVSEIAAAIDELDARRSVTIELALDNPFRIVVDDTCLGWDARAFAIICCRRRMSLSSVTVARR